VSDPRPHEPAGAPEAAPPGDRQRRVEALAEEYLEGLLAGRAPDRRAALAAHPDLADLLEPRLALVELMHRAARAPRAAERAVHIRCPHCGNGIQLVEPEAAEVTCGGCGSSFHLDLRATTSFSPAALPRSVGKFEVLEQLGRGTFGTVYKARDPQLQRLVAVKVPRAGSFATPEEEERFLREARAAAQLSHPGIVPVLEVAHDRGLPYIVSEYVEGLTLADLLTGRRPGFREAAELVAAVADALDYAHRQKVIHRDVKPSNLLIDRAGRPHVTDFGLARRGEGEITVTLDGQVLGTPAYMAPEQAAGDQQRVDARSDVYSLGVVLYELLTGELPFRGNQRMLLHQVLHDDPQPPRSLNDRIPRDLETICLKAMAKAPGRRYASALEMADDLRRFLNGEAIRARPVGRVERLARWAKRNPAVASLTVAVVLTLLTGTAVSAFFAIQAERRREQAERSQRDAELRAASAAVDLDLKHCADGEVDYGVLRLARTLRELPPHATDLRQCVEMNLLAWAQEIRPLGPTFQHDGAETKWELSPDGLTVLTGGADGTARLWDAFTGEVRATMRGHRGGINPVAFSQNGRVAMTVGEDRTVRLWEASSGQARGAPAEHPGRIDSALLSPDGHRLLTVCDDKVTLWDAATGRRISGLAGHSGHVGPAAFSPDGQTVLTGGWDKTARLWSADSGAALATLQTPTGGVTKVAVCPEGDVAATLEVDKDTRVRWWDLRRHEQIGPLCTSHGSPMMQWDFRALHRGVAVLDSEVGSNSETFYLLGMERAVEIPDCYLAGCAAADDTCFFDPLGRVYDRNSGKRRAGPHERKFSDELVPFATSGRFIVLQSKPSEPGVWTAPFNLIDLATEKAIGAGVYYRLTVRRIPDRPTFIAQSWPSPRYVPLPGPPLDAEVARLFAEVVTCQELDLSGTPQPLNEAEWEDRRKQLTRRIDEAPAPFLVSRVASDPWYWLRRHADDGKAPNEDRRKYLDRLIAVEPTWQNYRWRATFHDGPDRWIESARDYLEAARRAGDGFWQAPSVSYYSDVWKLVGTATGTPEQYQVGLQLAGALSRAKPEDREYRSGLAAAHYRLGHYAEVLSVLEPWQRERERAVIGQVGQRFMAGWPVALLDRQPVRGDELEAMAFLAMAQSRLGHRDQAGAILDDLRSLASYPFVPPSVSPTVDGVIRYHELLREAEAVIEGRSGPQK
jgi:hypothetical protein